MANSMVHWNGDIMAVVDTETTGVDPEVHEIYQFTMVPLDSFLNRRTDVLPLDLWIKPNRPECVEETKIQGHKKRVQHACLHGFDSIRAADLLAEYIETLKLPYTPTGTRKRIIPLGHNYGFDLSFIIPWLGKAAYNDIFSVLYRDTMSTALFLNDQRDFNNEKPFCAKVNLTYLATHLGITHGTLHDSLEDCLVTAEVFKRMCQTMVIGQQRGVTE